MRKSIIFHRFLVIFGLFWANCSTSQQIRVHDPVAIKQGDMYYIFCTGRGISVFSSPDLKNWKPEPQVFEKEPVWADSVSADFNNHIWAPDITLHDGKYYLYTVGEDKNEERIFELKRQIVDYYPGAEVVMF